MVLCLSAFSLREPVSTRIKSETGFRSKTRSRVEDRVLIHRDPGILLVLGIVVDRTGSRLDPAAFGDALTAGRWIKIAPEAGDAA